MASFANILRSWQKMASVANSITEILMMHACIHGVGTVIPSVPALPMSVRGV